jgi:hypothetical protein
MGSRRGGGGQQEGGAGGRLGQVQYSMVPQCETRLTTYHMLHAVFGWMQHAQHGGSSDLSHHTHHHMACCVLAFGYTWQWPSSCTHLTPACHRAAPASCWGPCMVHARGRCPRPSLPPPGVVSGVQAACGPLGVCPSGRPRAQGLVGHHMTIPWVGNPAPAWASHAGLVLLFRWQLLGTAGRQAASMAGPKPALTALHCSLASRGRRSLLASWLQCIVGVLVVRCCGLLLCSRATASRQKNSALPCIVLCCNAVGATEP